jgi:4-amino-4-deoxy-L-arabinose transferase-like glycosyltransferase
MRRASPEPGGRDRWALAVGTAAALVVLGLQWVAIERQSLIGDAPYHLLAGDQALRCGQNQLNLEHPPLVKLVAAWPLLDEEPLAPPVAMDRAIATSLRLFEDPERARRARRQARAVLLVVFALPFLVSCYFLGRWWGGPRVGVVLAASLGLSLSVLPFLSVIQTDTAVALAFVVTLLASLAYLERPTLLRSAAVGGGLGLALAAKYSGLLLLPPVLLAVVLADSAGRADSLWRRVSRWVGHLSAIAAVASALVYATYAVANRNYDPAVGRDTLERYVHGQGMITGKTLERQQARILAAERVDPNLAQWLTGLLGIRAQNDLGIYPTYAFGALSSRGRWWYFPALLLTQTPLVLLFALGCAAAGRRAGEDGEAPRRGAGKAATLLAVTAILYLMVAMTSSYNLGVRHLMPILPILYLPAARWAARRRLRTALLLGLLALDAIAAAPLWMSSTNTFWAGRFNPTRFAFGSLEYRQNFLALAAAARRRGIAELDVLYPLLQPAELAAYLPDARLLRPDTVLRPGSWVAVNILVEQYLPAAERASAETLRGQRNLVALKRTWTPLWQAVQAGEDHGYVAGTFHLYRLP